MASAMTAVQTLDGPTIVFEPVAKYNDLYLVALSTAVTCARLFVDFTMTTWGFKRSIPEVERIAAQLVGDAVKSTGILDELPRWSEITQLNMLVLRLRHTGRYIHVEVWDSSEEPPLGTPPVGYEAGYFTHDGGKVVWVKVPVIGDDPEPLPRRQPQPGPRRQSTGLEDIGLMERVRNGLGDL